jgi:hypothetical protein
MLRRLTPWVLLLLGCALASQGHSQSTGRPGTQALYPFELSAAEIRQARQLAESGFASSHGKTVFVKVDLLPDVQADTDQRQVQVTHYRYEGDLTVYTYVDLNNGAVLGVEVQAHAPTALATEEKTRAEELAAAEPRLAGLFAAHANLRVEMRPTQHTAPQHPLFGHRLALLAFGVGDGYLDGPTALVDLTTGQVHVEQTTR